MPIDRALEHNATVVHDPIDDGAVPTSGVAIVTCMDARIDPARLFGLERGAAHVLRNAGARVTDDVVRSLVLSTWVLRTREVMLMQHTRCGALGDDAEVREQLAAGGAPSIPLDLRTFTDHEQSLRADIDGLYEGGLLPPDVSIRGFLLDIATGRVDEVVPAR
jgi:carbonic anhydrase